jgi:hypothetical protein
MSDEGDNAYPLYNGLPPHVVLSPPSRGAAVQIEEGTAAMREAIFELVFQQGDRGLTCDEIEVHLGMKHQTASARIRELVQLGRLTDSGRVRPTRSVTKTGRPFYATVWVPHDGPYVRPPVKPCPRCRLLEKIIAGLHERLGDSDGLPELG